MSEQRYLIYNIIDHGRKPRSAVASLTLSSSFQTVLTVCESFTDNLINHCNQIQDTVCRDLIRKGTICCDFVVNTHDSRHIIPSNNECNDIYLAVYEMKISFSPVSALKKKKKKCKSKHYREGTYSLDQNMTIINWMSLFQAIVKIWNNSKDEAQIALIKQLIHERGPTNASLSSAINMFGWLYWL